MIEVYAILVTAILAAIVGVILWFKYGRVTLINEARQKRRHHDEMDAIWTRTFDNIDRARSYFGQPPCDRPKTYNEKREGK